MVDAIMFGAAFSLDHVFSNIFMLDSSISSTAHHNGGRFPAYFTFSFMDLFGFTAAKPMKPKYTFLMQFFYVLFEKAFFREMKNKKVMASYIIYYTFVKKLNFHFFLT